MLNEIHEIHEDIGRHKYHVDEKNQNNPNNHNGKRSSDAYDEELVDHEEVDAETDSVNTSIIQ